MTNYVLAFEGERCPDGAVWLPEKEGISFRTDEREVYRRRLVTPDELIVREFLNTGVQTGNEKEVFPGEGEAICDFVSRYGFPTQHAAINKEDGSILYPIADNIFNIIGFRWQLQQVWDDFERGKLESDPGAGLLDLGQGAVDRLNCLLAFHSWTLTPKLRFHEGDPALTLQITSLGAFMMMETALVVTGGGAVKRCETCGAFFNTGPGTGRRDTAMYCSNRCRVAAQRAAKKPVSRKHKSTRKGK